MTHSWAVVGVEEMRSLEAAAKAAGISEEQLQANAAVQIADVAAGLCPAGKQIVVLIGPGNNGRDAFLAGRLLAQQGRSVRYVLGPRHAIGHEELRSLDPLREAARVHGVDHDAVILEQELQEALVAIDGLLGIGVRGPMRSPLDALAQALNRAAAQSDLWVVSVDVPSGIDADSGEVPGEVVSAHWTVALGAAKAGCLRFPAAAHVGRLEPRPIGLPVGGDSQCPVRLLTPQAAAPLVPDRPLDAHKGTLGWVMVVGGSHEYVGAPILSASAAARAGCGLVALAVPANAQTAAASSLPEATYLLRDLDQAPSLQAERLLDRLADFRALLLGPGLGRDVQTNHFVRSLLIGLAQAEHTLAVILDADALNTLAGWELWWEHLPPRCVVTPHHGEMARLTGLAATQIARRAWETATEYATLWSQIVVLKGPHSVVAMPDGRAWVHPRPNPALATAGTGDILAGLTAGLAAQGLQPGEAAKLAVVAHARAAEKIVEARRWRSLVASDLLPLVPEVLAELSN